MKLACFIRSFAAGFLSTLIFHQGVFAALYTLSILLIQPYNLSPTQPLGVPSVISLAFFGGIWGILIWKVVKNLPLRTQIFRSIVFGAVGPTFVAFAVVFPLKGAEFNPAFIPIGLLLNAFWGLGLWLFMYPKISK